MAFTDEIARFQATVHARSRAVFVNVAAAAKSSITDGSPLTGAPGSPVDTGTLKNSWMLEFPSASEALISTNVEYAPHVEDNVRNARFRVGGAHSVALTMLGLDRIVEDETQKVVDRG